MNKKPKENVTAQIIVPPVTAKARLIEEQFDANNVPNADGRRDSYPKSTYDCDFGKVVFLPLNVPANDIYSTDSYGTAPCTIRVQAKNDPVIKTLSLDLFKNEKVTRTAISVTKKIAQVMADVFKTTEYLDPEKVDSEMLKTIVSDAVKFCPSFNRATGYLPSDEMQEIAEERSRA